MLKEHKDTHFILKASFLEIYNEKVIDLLNPGTARKPLAVRWSKKSRSFFVENLFTVDCEELDDLMAVLEEGKRGCTFTVQVQLTRSLSLPVQACGTGRWARTR